MTRRGVPAPGAGRRLGRDREPLALEHALGPGVQAADVTLPPPVRTG